MGFSPDKQRAKLPPGDYEDAWLAEHFACCYLDEQVRCITAIQNTAKNLVVIFNVERDNYNETIKKLESMVSDLKTPWYVKLWRKIK